MPVYEYGCKAGHRFEVKQKFSDAPVTTCQICSLPVTKLISASGISFKGSGWYVTDYSNKMKEGTAEKSPSQEKATSPSGAQNDSSTSKGDAKTSAPASPAASGSTSSSDGSSSAGPAPSSPSPSGS
jgi:putative FmdB family regulatory protein